VFAVGLIMMFAALAMAVSAVFAPSVALPGLIGGAAGLAIAGFVLAYLAWPERKSPPHDGMVRASAWVIDAEPTQAEVTGYRMVDLTLEVRPKDAAPFQVRRRFVGSRAGFEVGSAVTVFYDPVDPDRIELG
jgi:hypothetical protein